MKETLTVKRVGRNSIRETKTYELSLESSDPDNSDYPFTLRLTRTVDVNGEIFWGFDDEYNPEPLELENMNLTEDEFTEMCVKIIEGKAESFERIVYEDKGDKP